MRVQVYEANSVHIDILKCHLQYELVEFDGIWLTHAEQYRWLQVDYQIGVFISRSSVNLVTINKIWIMAVLQVTARSIKCVYLSTQTVSIQRGPLIECKRARVYRYVDVFCYSLSMS